MQTSLNSCILICNFKLCFQQSENRDNASDSEAEALSDKKKKKKKKKKAKSNSDVEKLLNESTVVQDPPRIEVLKCFFQGCQRFVFVLLMWWLRSI